jgi:release factor glutamine methyltransferase
MSFSEASTQLPGLLAPGTDFSAVVDAAAAALRVAGCVFAEDEAALLAAAAVSPAELDRLVDRRATGVPLEYVLGWAGFGGLRLAVDEGVFVPRRRTEFLVDLAVDLAREAANAGPAGSPAGHRPRAGASASPPRRSPGLLVVDLCCGSGALGAALTARLRAPAVPEQPRDPDPGPGRGATPVAGRAPGVEVDLHAADLDPAAVRCARRNLAPLGGTVYEGDLYAALPPALRGRVDILLANAPYVPTSAIELLPTEAREHEATVALDGGEDGLAVVRRVFADAADWLAPGGSLLVEASEDQAALLLAAGARGLDVRAVHSDDHDTTVVIAAKPGLRTRVPGAAAARGAVSGPDRPSTRNVHAERSVSVGESSPDGPAEQFQHGEGPAAI